MIKYLCFLLLFTNLCSAQVNTSFIIGTWKFDKMISSDTTNKAILKNSENARNNEVVFKSNGEVTATQFKDGKVQFLGSSKYNFSEDKKYLYQDQKESEVLELTATSLVLKVDEEITIHFKKKIEFGEAIKISNVFVLQTKLINNTTKESIPNATIKNIVNNETVKANLIGDFKLKVTNTDSILITCIGYQNKMVCANDIEFVNEISLTENKTLLSEVIVNPTPKKSILLNDFSNCGSYFLVSSGSQLQAAQEFHSENGYLHLKKIHICKAHGYSKFRVWIYDVDSVSGAPTTKLIANGIEVKSAKRNVIIDVEKYNINLLHPNFFISIEWLFEEENKHMVKQRSLNNIKQKVAEYEPSISIRNSNAELKSWSLSLYNGKAIWRRDRSQVLLISAEITQ